ncbi:MAG: methyltransferase domain-containing protein, partial [Methylotenera sp.]|nr:methyltransferase domain-containing protein [Flavobacterium sp.]
MSLITKDDIFDTYGKLKQRGLSFILSKFNPSNKKRTLSAFDDVGIDASNYWNIPLVKKRWNKKITGNESEIFEDYVIRTYLQHKENLKMISLGAGVCNHEIHFANKGNFSEVLCIDFASSLLKKGKLKSKQLGLSNIEFASLDASKMQVKPDYYDIIMFHSSLHHFFNVDNIIGNIAFKTLKKGGLLIIHEYVGPNRLQLTSIQIRAINQALATIPANCKTRYKTNITKNTVSGP